LTTQQLEEAEQLADRIAILHEGKIIVNGTLADLKKLFPPARVEYMENSRAWRKYSSLSSARKRKLNGSGEQTLFQRYGRYAWTVYAPYFPQHGHYPYGHHHPIAMMLLFVYVFGGAIQTGTDNYVNYLLPVSC